MDPVIVKKGHYSVEVEAGKNYHWCACGKSANQPYCDGSHKGSDFTPLAFTPDKTGSAHLCGCKHTKKAPYCDGCHKTL